METSKERTAKWRAMQTNFDKKMIREKDRADKAMKRAMMTEEEKQRVREKDRIRKALKRGVPSVKEKVSNAVYGPNEREHNRMYKVKRRQGQSEAETEFERIDNLLIKRKSRERRSIEERERDKKEAREGMQYERILPFKKRRPKGHVVAILEEEL